MCVKESANSANQRGLFCTSHLSQVGQRSQRCHHAATVLQFKIRSCAAWMRSSSVAGLAGQFCVSVSVLTVLYFAWQYAPLHLPPYGLASHLWPLRISIWCQAAAGRGPESVVSQSGPTQFKVTARASWSFHLRADVLQIECNQDEPFVLYLEVSEKQDVSLVWRLQCLKMEHILIFSKCRINTMWKVGESFCILYQYICQVCPFLVDVWDFMSSLVLPSNCPHYRIWLKTWQYQGQSCSIIKTASSFTKHFAWLL